MKKIVTFIALGILSFIIYGCSFDTTSPQVNDHKNIMPLKAGNSWTYNVHQFNQDIIKKAVVTGITIIENDHKPTFVYIVTWFTFANDEWIEEDVHYYKNEFRGLYRYHEDKKELIAKYPIELNETWTTPGETEDLGNGMVGIISWPRTYECLLKDKEILTPAGIFNCIKYVENSAFYMYPVYSYYSPGIGLIKSSCGFIYRELIEYYIEEE